MLSLTTGPTGQSDATWIAKVGRHANNHLLEMNMRLVEEFGSKDENCHLQRTAVSPDPAPGRAAASRKPGGFGRLARIGVCDPPPMVASGAVSNLGREPPRYTGVRIRAA